LAIAAGILLLAALVFWGYPGLLVKGIGEYELEAMAYYQAGDYSEAIKICQTLQEKSPQRSLGYLILANIHFLEGDLKKARGLFKEALEAENGTDSEKAEALIGLGRIASIEKNADQALSFYQQAARLTPNKAQPYVSQGILLDRKGKVDEALELFVKAQAMAPNDRGIQAIVNETRERAALNKNKEKRERIDKLVRELLENLDKAGPSISSDGWTSLPLTVWVMDFKSSGYCLREGEERLIACGMMDQLIGKSRVQVVERALFDKLLEELKLGTSRLVDPATALSLGKIMAARVILSGQTHYAGPQTQTSVRLIETETGQVVGAVNEVFVNVVSPSLIAEKLSHILLAKFQALYPLRGKISKVGDEGITLNIGGKQGVQGGQQFKVLDTDWILEISDVQMNQSTAKVKRGYGTIKSGLRVEFLQEGEKPIS
jgi:tetratricopeptide (TPR) repeat protein